MLWKWSWKSKKKSRQKRQTQDFWWLLSGILVSLLVFVCCNFLEGGSFDLQWILKQFVGLFPIVINGCVYSSTNTVSKNCFYFPCFFCGALLFGQLTFKYKLRFFLEIIQFVLEFYVTQPTGMKIALIFGPHSWCIHDKSWRIPLAPEQIPDLWQSLHLFFYC